MNKRSDIEQFKHFSKLCKITICPPLLLSGCHISETDTIQEKKSSNKKYNKINNKLRDDGDMTLRELT